MAPLGITSSLFGGGDCRRLPSMLKLFSAMSESAVPGGVGSDISGVVANDAVFTEGVRRCRVRYEADLGNSGLGGEAGGPSD